MSRPIKFRAFVKPNNGLQNYSGTYEVLVLSTDCVVVKRSSVFAHDRFSLDVVELHQFTGLLDASGKEIYEGDTIVGYGWPKGNNEYKVIFTGGKFCAFRKTGNPNTKFELLPLDCLEDMLISVKEG